MKTLELKHVACTQTSETRDVAKSRVVFRARFAGTFTPGSINSPIPSGRLDLTIADYGLVGAKVADSEGTAVFGTIAHVPLGEPDEIQQARVHAAWLMDSPPHDVIAEYQGVMVQRGLDLDE
jgi:hypothetical protein